MIECGHLLWGALLLSMAANVVMLAIVLNRREKKHRRRAPRRTAPVTRSMSHDSALPPRAPSWLEAHYKNIGRPMDL